MMKKITLLFILLTISLGFSQATIFTVQVPGGTQGVRMTGTWWSWNPVGGPVATQGPGNTWSVTIWQDGAPQEAFEYLWVITTADGSATAGTGQENLIDNASGALCTERVVAGTLITDYNNYANRKFLPGPASSYEIYDDCALATLAVNRYDKINFKIYPNPTQNNWTVSSSNTIHTIQVFDILGKQVVWLTPNTTEANIDASALKSGLYFAKINTDKGSSSLKLVRE